MKPWIQQRSTDLRRAIADERGVSAVEFAALSPLFLATVFVATMSGILFMAKSELDYMTQKVAREIMTGQVTTSSGLQTALCNATGGIFSCSNMIVNLSSYSSMCSGSSCSSSALNLTTQTATATPTLTYNGSGGVSNTWSSSFGSAGSIMVLQVMYQYPMIAGELFNLGSDSNGTDMLISTAVFVNE